MGYGSNAISALKYHIIRILKRILKSVQISFHFRINAKERLKLLVDNNGFEETEAI